MRRVHSPPSSRRDVGYTAGAIRTRPSFVVKSGPLFVERAEPPKSVHELEFAPLKSPSTDHDTDHRDTAMIAHEPAHDDLDESLLERRIRLPGR